jgi:hypothetical protein
MSLPHAEFVVPAEPLDSAFIAGVAPPLVPGVPAALLVAFPPATGVVIGNEEPLQLFLHDAAPVPPALPLWLLPPAAASQLAGPPGETFPLVVPVKLPFPPPPQP